MASAKWRLVAALFGLGLMLLACSDQSAARLEEQQRQIALGEKIFAEKECAKCHMEPSEEIVPGIRPPDLTSVFLAMDTLTVKTHLQFTELTKMPTIALTSQEISALTQYVGALHGKANSNPNLQNPDATCSVCGAPVKAADAEANFLKATFEDKSYYFECPDCKIVFERDPAARSKSGYAAARSR